MKIINYGKVLKRIFTIDGPSTIPNNVLSFVKYFCSFLVKDHHFSQNNLSKRKYPVWFTPLERKMIFLFLVQHFLIATCGLRFIREFLRVTRVVVVVVVWRLILNYCFGPDMWRLWGEQCDWTVDWGENFTLTSEDDTVMMPSPSPHSSTANTDLSF